MNLQKKLIQLSEYKCSFKYVDSYFLVSVIYPNNWSVIPSEDRTIDVGEEGGVTFYAAPIETDIEKAFSLIDDTISYNLDVEKKMALLKYNIGKLQELFADKDLEELETIEFIFKPKKKEAIKETSVKKNTKKTTRKYTRKKDVAEDTQKKQKSDNFELLRDESKNFNFTCLTNDDSNEGETIQLEVNNEPLKIENKYLEEIER